MPAGAKHTKHTLMVIDDEPDVLESVGHLFHRTYRVLTAENGEDALATLRREDVQLILCDQRMPGMTGDAILAQARELQPDAVRILFTGYADLQAVVSAVNQGHIFRYVNKPWDPGELTGILRQASEYHDLRSDRRRLIHELQAANYELIRANEALTEAAQLKQAFLEVASHEFNTPITIVLGLTELLKLSSANFHQDELQILDQLSSSAHQLSRLVRNTLTLMHGKDYRRTLHFAQVDLAKLLNEAADKVEPFIKVRQIKLNREISPDLGAFEIDPDKIDPTVVNLLSNAIKFSPDGATVTLRANLTEPDEVQIAVIDHGLGLDPKALLHLFEPLFTEYDPKLHSSGEFGFGKRGLGVGLAIVKQFVELHGGKVEAQSRLHEGTEVTITLNRHQALPSGV